MIDFQHKIILNFVISNETSERKIISYVVLGSSWSFIFIRNLIVYLDETHSGRR